MVSKVEGHACNVTRILSYRENSTVRDVFIGTRLATGLTLGPILS